MIKSLSRLVFLFACALVVPCLGQDSLVTIGKGTLSTAAEILTQRHISLTKDSLVEALRNDDAQIRYLAAVQLAEDRVKDAIPAIIQALEVERTPQGKVYIANALAEMGD